MPYATCLALVVYEIRLLLRPDQVERSMYPYSALMAWNNDNYLFSFPKKTKSVYGSEQ